MAIAEDFEAVRSLLLEVKVGYVYQPLEDAIAALERIRVKQRTYVDAAYRVGNYLNKAHARRLARGTGELWIDEVRMELGPAYLGGPLA